MSRKRTKAPKQWNQKQQGNQRNQRNQQEQQFRHEDYTPHKKPDPVQPLTQNQEFLFDAIEAEPREDGSDCFVFATGYAGTGKTYVSTMLGAELLDDKCYRKLIIIKPTVGAEDNGFLPGDINEKMDPWMDTVKAPLIEYMGAERFEREFGRRIIAESIQFLRGKTLDNSFIVIDESQNLTIPQIKMILTRIGKNSKMVFCGDDSQCDLPKKTPSGLAWFINLLEKRNEAGIEVIRFTKKDSVRSGACAKAIDIIESAYIYE